MKTKNLFVSLVSLAILVPYCLTAFAQNPQGSGEAAQAVGDIPRVISYQGLIRGNDYQPINDGKHRLVVTLYTDENGTTPLWSDSYEIVTDQGIFNVLLGS